MAVVNLETKAPPTDTSVLGRTYLLADDDVIRAAIANLQFEMRLREDRANASAAIKDRHAQLAADVHMAIEEIEAAANERTKEGSL